MDTKSEPLNSLHPATPLRSRRDAVLAALGASMSLALSGCGGGDKSTSSSVSSSASSSSSRASPTRTWRLGFSPTPPKPVASVLLDGVDRWSQRAELAAIHEDIPWADLLAGMTPDAILDRDKVQLVAYLRGKGLALYFMADLTNGLSRAEDAAALKAAGRSLTEPAIQQLYRNYVLAVVRKLQPEYLGLAAETNLIRAIAPSTLYAAVKQAANAAATDVRLAGYNGTLISTVQVEAAWGVLGSSGPYVGVDVDLSDFAFSQVLGLSSYPYFGYAQPEDIPDNYYSRLLGNRTLPIMVLEGGWTSATVGTLTSTPDKQARYLTRQAQLLDSVNARALVQLLYADLDITTFPQPIPVNLPLFTSLGLTDSNFAAKPALAVWDSLYARVLR